MPTNFMLKKRSKSCLHRLISNNYAKSQISRGNMITLQILFYFDDQQK